MAQGRVIGSADRRFFDDLMQKVSHVEIAQLQTAEF
jgi:hypothetical protein